MKATQTILTRVELAQEELLEVSKALRMLSTAVDCIDRLSVPIGSLPLVDQLKDSARGLYTLSVLLDTEVGKML